MRTSLSQFNYGCEVGWTRDYWFRFLPHSIVDYYAMECNVHEDAFFAFLVIVSCVFFVGIFLSLLAFVFQKQRSARLHLLLVCMNGGAGMGITVGTITRDDFTSGGSPGLLILWTISSSLTLAHSLLMTETVKGLSLKIAPSHMRGDEPMIAKIMESSLIQRVFLWIAGIEVIAMAVCYLLCAFMTHPDDDPTASHWLDAGPQGFYKRSDFWWFAGCMAGLIAHLTFIVIPIRHHYRLWRYIKESREKTQTMLVTPGSPPTTLPRRVSGTALSSNRRSLEDMNGAGGGGAPIYPVSAVRPSSLGDLARVGGDDDNRFPGEESEGENKGGEGGGGDDGSPPTGRTRKMSISSVTNTVERKLSRSLINVENSFKNVVNPPIKRRLTVAEIQRKNVLVFETKMQQTWLLGIVAGTAALTVWVLICDARTVGPLAPLMLIGISCTFLLQFSVIHLYFPERILHQLFVARLPQWMVDRIDGIEEERFEKLMMSVNGGGGGGGEDGQANNYGVSSIPPRASV